jgi:flavin-dependent dehydrogenase
MIGGREVENHYPRPVSYGIRRCEFDDYLLARSGARRCATEMVDSIERNGGGWIINGTLRTRLLVGAGGHFCPVARMLGARSVPGTLVVAAQEVEFPAAAEDLAEGTIEAAVPELYFCRDLAGYGWCFRKGDYLNIGLGRTEREQLSTHVHQFADFLRASGKVRAEIPGHFHGHAYQLYERTQPVLCDDGVLLVGDAAGLAYPQSGEGIRPAVESGLLAAGVIAAADGNFARERVQAYERRVIARLGRPRSQAASDWLPASWLRALAARLLASKRFARGVVIERWFLHMHEPALAPAAALAPLAR